MDVDNECPVCGRPLINKKKKALTILGLAGWDDKDITQEVVKKAYHSLARVSHPDVGGDTDVFNEIRSARDTLMNQDLADKKLEKEIEEVGRETLINHVHECREQWRPGMTCPICRR